MPNLTGGTSHTVEGWRQEEHHLAEHDLGDCHFLLPAAGYSGAGLRGIKHIITYQTYHLCINKLPCLNVFKTLRQE